MEQTQKPGETMNIKEEQRMVLKFLGYTSCDRLPSNAIGGDSECWVKGDVHRMLSIYNPFSETSQRHVWDEIFDNFSDKQWDRFIRHLKHYAGGFSVEFMDTWLKNFLRVKPPILWAALIKTLEDK